MNLKSILFLTGMMAGSFLRAAPTPVDFVKGTVEGVLPNGLHYVVLPNTTPVHNVELRLVMRLGSVQETDEQKGAAHFLEHMAFGGTRHFPKRTMVEYLESLGMKYGRDINAVTGYDRTIFMLSVPMKKENTQVLDSALLVLRDWLDGISFEEERTRQERGVILEELRGYDLGDNFYSLKIGNSRFTQRMPLGTADDIRSIDRKKLVQFYKKWYSPQLASVIVVGDVDTTQAVRLIQERFADVRKKKVRGITNYPLTYDRGIQIKEYADTLTGKSEIEFIIPHAAIVTRTMDAMIRKEQGGLLVNLLSRRLDDRGLNCQISDAWYLSNRNHFVVSVRGEDRSELRRQLLSALAELDYVVREGFATEELQHACADYMQRITLPDAERRSSEWCDDFTDYALSGDRYVHTSKDLDRLKEGLQHTTSRDLQDILSGWLSAKDTTLLVACKNHQENMPQLTAAWVRQVLQDKDTVSVAPYHFEARKETQQYVQTPACLAQTFRFNPAEIKSEKQYPGMRTTEIVLKNGLTLILRPTPDYSGRVLVNLFGRGGVGDLPKDSYHRYEGTAGFMEIGGIAKVPSDTLAEYMLLKNLSMNVSVSNSWHDILASAPNTDIQALLNLMFEKMYDPELCYQDFEEIKQEELDNWNKESTLEKMMKVASDRRLTNRMNVLVGSVPPAAQTERTKRDVETSNLDSIAAYYKMLFTNPEGMTMVITGDYEVEDMKKKVVPVFARMKQDANTAVPNSMRRPKLVQKHQEGFPNDNESQTVLEYVFPGHYKPSLRNSLVLKLVRDVLQNRVLEILREQEHIVYSPYVSLFYNGNPEQSYYLNVSLSVDYENTNRTDSIVRSIIRDLQQKPISEAELRKLKRSFQINKMQVLTPNASTEWRNTLVNLVKNGEALADFDAYDNTLDQITVGDVQKAFCDYMDADEHILLYIGRHQTPETDVCSHAKQ